MSKVRYVDFNPAELLADTAGELTIDEFSVYWMICTLIYRRRERISDDAEWLKGKFKKADVRRIRSAIDGLIAKEKVHQSDGKLYVNRCETELKRAQKRIETAQENGLNGGRPRKENNELENQSGLSEKSYNQPPLPTTNNQSISAPKKALDGFEEFWAAYPLKKSKGRAEKYYRAAIKHTDAAVILEAVRNHQFSADPKFIPHASTWLNDKRWLDGPPKGNGRYDELNFL